MREFHKVCLKQYIKRGYLQKTKNIYITIKIIMIALFGLLLSIILIFSCSACTHHSGLWPAVQWAAKSSWQPWKRGAPAGKLVCHVLVVAVAVLTTSGPTLQHKSHVLEMPLELCQINVEDTIRAKDSWDRGHDLTEKHVETGEGIVRQLLLLFKLE